jgi:hypothetical protein
MRQGFTLAFTVILSISALAQAPAQNAQTPKAVIEQYWNQEANGGRLTDAGWNRANTFFLKPSSPPPTR